MPVDKISSPNHISSDETNLFSEEERQCIRFNLESKTRPIVHALLTHMTPIDDKTTHMTLSDGSSWDVHALLTHMTLSDRSSWDVQHPASKTLLKVWKKGDEIRINRLRGIQRPLGKKDVFLLRSTSDDTLAVATLNDKTDALKKLAVVVDKVAVDGSLVVTKNHGSFSIGYIDSFTTERWEKGRPLIINKSFYRGDYPYYLMLDPETKQSFWVSRIEYKG